MNLEMLQEQLTRLRLDWIRVQEEEIGDTTRYIFQGNIPDLCFARREDETQRYTARDIRDILINCPPQRRIVKVHYSTQNTRLSEDQIPEATEKRVAYIEALYALALAYKDALLAALVSSERPVPTLAQTIRGRFDAAIEVLQDVDARHPNMSLVSFVYGLMRLIYKEEWTGPGTPGKLPGLPKDMWELSLHEFTEINIQKLKDGDIAGLHQYFDAFRYGWEKSISPEWLGELRPFYEEYRLARFWCHVANLARELSVLAIELGSVCGEATKYTAILAKISAYLDAEKLEAMDYLELCVLGPTNLEFMLLDLEKIAPEFGTYSREVIALMGRIRAGQRFEPTILKNPCRYDLYRYNEEHRQSQIRQGLQIC